MDAVRATGMVGVADFRLKAGIDADVGSTQLVPLFSATFLRATP